jgi:putative nucleotidyltransferase with HDIG domain
MDKTDEYIGRVKHLPPAPTAATELLDLFNDPNRDIDRVVDLIGLDPSLTAEVLGRCNSAFLRGAEPASNIFDAVSRLGFYEVYCVVAAVVGARTLSLGRANGPLDKANFWRHSVTTAVAAVALARRVEQPEAVAFTTGLLHDVGKLVFASVEEAAYAGLIRQTGGFGSALAKAEEAQLGVTHATVGARLLARWALPSNIALAVLHHHHSPAAAAPFERLAAIVHLANCLAHFVTDNAPRELAASNPDAMVLLELTAQEVPAVVEEIKEGLQRAEGLLQMMA